MYGTVDTYIECLRQAHCCNSMGKAHAVCQRRDPAKEDCWTCQLWEFDKDSRTVYRCTQIHASTHSHHFRALKNYGERIEKKIAENLWKQTAALFCFNRLQSESHTTYRHVWIAPLAPQFASAACSASAKPSCLRSTSILRMAECAKSSVVTAHCSTTEHWQEVHNRLY